MIKYPLYVTLDTNILYANHYNFSDKSTLGLLKKLVKERKIKVVLSDIVIREAERHIKSYCAETRRIFKKAGKDANKLFSIPLIKSIGFSNHLALPAEAAINEKAQGEFKSFLQDIHAERLDMSQVDFTSIVDDYFAVKAPFENKEKKRKEFPDAIIASEIRERFGKSDVVAIVSKDEGFKKACKKIPSHLFFSSLPDLYDAISKRDQDYSKAVTIIQTLAESIIESIDECIDDDIIEVCGLSYDKDGISYGKDYDEYYLKSHKIKSIRIHVIDDIDETRIIATLAVEGDFTADCYYNDYDNAVWDSEEKEYMFLDIVHIVEEHKARFACRVEIDRENNSISVLPFKIILGGDSRVNSYNYDEIKQAEESRQDAEQVEMGFQPLSGYSDYLDADLANSEMSRQIVGVFNKINEIGSKYEDLSCVYDDLSSLIDRGVNAESFQELLSRMEGVKGFPSESDGEVSIEAIKNWADKRYETLYERSETLSLPDSISYGETFAIPGADGRKYSLKLDKLSSTPERGDSISISVELTDTENQKSIIGYNELTVGYQDFDEEGNAGYGVDDSVDYNCDGIIEAIADIYRGLRVELSDEESIAEAIDQIIGPLTSEI